MSPERGGSNVPPALEIAWARAISRAVDDPDFAKRLEDEPNVALAEFGVDVPDGLDVKTDLNPPHERAIEAIKLYRAKVQGVRAGHSWAPPSWQYGYYQAPSGGASSQAPSASAPVHPFSASVHPLTVASTAPMPPGQQPAATIYPYSYSASAPPLTYHCTATVSCSYPPKPYSASGYMSACEGALPAAPEAEGKPASSMPMAQWLGGRPSTGGY